MDARDVRWLCLTSLLGLSASGLGAAWLNLGAAEPPGCPCCGQSGGAIPVVYGRPTAETCEAARDGRCRIGPRGPAPDRPVWYCPPCGTEWPQATRPRITDGWPFR